jgi:peroxiredoxin
MLQPRQPVPALRVPTLRHGDFELLGGADALTMLVFYRGHHCPICMTQLKELQGLVPEFQELGVRVLAISSDTEERAAQTEAKLGAGALPLGHGLPLSTARAWGLFISQGRGKTSIGIEEPALFSEPGLFVVRGDLTLYYASVQTMPFARPSMQDMLKALNFAIKNDYPARGEYEGPLP